MFYAWPQMYTNVQRLGVSKNFKVPYYGFLKMSFHAVCNTALSE